MSSSNNVDMSLDDIIKAGKKSKTSSTPKRSGGARRLSPKKSIRAAGGGRGGIGNKGGVVKRKPVGRQGRRNLTQKAGTSRKSPRVVKRGNGAQQRKVNAKATTVATKILVQKLVKKALAQTQKSRPVVVGGQNVRSIVRNIRRRSAGGGIVKKNIVLNRISPRSRLISRPNRRIAVMPTVMPRAVRQQIVYATPSTFGPQIAAAPMRRRRPVRPIIIQQQQPQQPIFLQRQPSSRIIYRQPQQQQMVNVKSVRGQVNAMRRQQMVMYVQQPQQFQSPKPRRQFVVQQPQQQQQFVRHRVQRPQQYRPQQQNVGGGGYRKNQGGQQRRVIKTEDPFYDPPNFLQRVPSGAVTLSSRFARN